MQKTYEIIFQDVYGGDGFVRYQDFEENVLTRTKTSTKTRDDIGVPVSSAMNEVMTATVKKDINTFKYLDGTPIMRLGGAHGKLWGALKEIRSTLYMLGNKGFRSARLVDMIQVTPIWVPLEIMEPIQVQQLPQILNTPGRAMITMLFDVIPKAGCQVTLTYPDSIAEQVSTLVNMLSTISLLNKRRATIESMTEI